VVEKGEIVEQGSHEELLRVKGFYARLCALQVGVMREEGITGQGG
jgi:ABC-type multidrug transport system fused ATPase/permease subunit